MKYSLLFGSMLVAATTTFTVGHFSNAADSDVERPVEVGLVNWGRDLDAAFDNSKKSGKPVLVLFQEVPGCAGCQKFGREVLSNPVIVDAVEREFEPVLVYNNRGGKDEAIRKAYREPAWNYQVLRFLDSSGKDIIPRKEQVWTTNAVASRMVDALKASSRTAPRYLTTAVGSGTHDRHSIAALAMSCFWTGEYRLGGIQGVVATEAGWLDGREVTLIKYDSTQLPLEKLAQQAAKVQCAQKLYTPQGLKVAGLPVGKLDKSYRPASTSDQKRQIKKWEALQGVAGLNAMQLTKLNALAPRNMDEALAWLSPRQRMMLKTDR